MPDVLACVDHSAYANSVCDHAGWFASDPDVGVEVLHVVEGAESAPLGSAPNSRDETPCADALVARAVRRLREEGVGPITSAQVPGAFVDVACRRGASVVVMGKRGDLGETERGRLGSSVDAVVRRAPGPVCLTSRYFLPIHRAVVLLDADLTHRAALEFMARDPRMAALPVDVVVVAGQTEDAEPKAAWARSVLGSRSAEIFPLLADGLDDAVADHLQTRAADLIVVSRAVIAPAPQVRLEQIEERGVWGMRTPVLIC